jgi:hypothetical protein
MQPTSVAWGLVSLQLAVLPALARTQPNMGEPLSEILMVSSDDEFNEALHGPSRRGTTLDHRSGASCWAVLFVNGEKEQLPSISLLEVRLCMHTRAPHMVPVLPHILDIFSVARLDSSPVRPLPLHALRYVCVVNAFSLSFHLFCRRCSPPFLTCPPSRLASPTPRRSRELLSRPDSKVCRRLSWSFTAVGAAGSRRTRRWRRA